MATINLISGNLFLFHDSLFTFEILGAPVDSNYSVRLNGKEIVPNTDFSETIIFDYTLLSDFLDVGSNALVVRVEGPDSSTYEESFTVIKKSMDSVYFSSTEKHAYTYSLKVSNAYTTLLRIPDVKRYRGYVLRSVLKLDIISSGGATGDIQIAPINTGWNSTNLNVLSPPSINVGEAITVPVVDTPGLVELDVTELVEYIWTQSVGRGIALYTSSYSIEFSSLNAEIVYEYQPTILHRPSQVLGTHVDLSWEPYIIDRISAFKRVNLQRSTTESFASPTTVFTTTDREILSYRDENVEERDYYYRIEIEMENLPYNGDKLDFNTAEHYDYPNTLEFIGGVVRFKFRPSEVAEFDLSPLSNVPDNVVSLGPVSLDNRAVKEFNVGGSIDTTEYYYSRSMSDVGVIGDGRLYKSKMYNKYLGYTTLASLPIASIGDTTLSYIVIRNLYNIISSNCTIDFLFKLREPDTGGTHQPFVAYGGYISGGFTLQVIGGSYLRLSCNGNTIVDSPPGFADLVSGELVRLSIVVSDEYFKVYVNGALCMDRVSIPISDHYLSFGRRLDTESQRAPMLIGDIRIWNYPMPEDTIQSLVSVLGSENSSGLVHHYSKYVDSNYVDTIGGNNAYLYDASFSQPLDNHNFYFLMESGDLRFTMVYGEDATELLAVKEAPLLNTFERSGMRKLSGISDPVNFFSVDIPLSVPTDNGAIYNMDIPIDLTVFNTITDMSLAPSPMHKSVAKAKITTSYTGRIHNAILLNGLLIGTTGSNTIVVVYPDGVVEVNYIYDSSGSLGVSRFRSIEYYDGVYYLFLRNSAVVTSTDLRSFNLLRAESTEVDYISTDFSTSLMLSNGVIYAFSHYFYCILEDGVISDPIPSSFGTVYTSIRISGGCLLCATPSAYFFSDSGEITSIGQALYFVSKLSDGTYVGGASSALYISSDGLSWSHVSTHSQRIATVTQLGGKYILADMAEGVYSSTSLEGPWDYVGEYSDYYYYGMSSRADCLFTTEGILVGCDENFFYHKNYLVCIFEYRRANNWLVLDGYLYLVTYNTKLVFTNDMVNFTSIPDLLSKLGRIGINYFEIYYHFGHFIFSTSDTNYTRIVVSKDLITFSEPIIRIEGVDGSSGRDIAFIDLGDVVLSYRNTTDYGALYFVEVSSIVDNVITWGDRYSQPDCYKTLYSDGDLLVGFSGANYRWYITLLDKFNGYSVISKTRLLMACGSYPKVVKYFNWYVISPVYPINSSRYANTSFLFTKDFINYSYFSPTYPEGYNQLSGIISNCEVLDEFLVCVSQFNIHIIEILEDSSVVMLNIPIDLSSGHLFLKVVDGDLFIVPSTTIGKFGRVKLFDAYGTLVNISGKYYTFNDGEFKEVESFPSEDIYITEGITNLSELVKAYKYKAVSMKSESGVYRADITEHISDAFSIE